jgi:hypothetical protein
VDYSRVRDEPRTANARGIGGLWVRVLGASPAEPLVADGMDNRPIRGVVEWMPAEIVVDVPNDATGIWIGFWMQGRGQIWASRLQLTEVPKSVPVTAEPAPPTGPRNLSLQ